MKKILALFVSVVMAFCLCSCTSQSKEEKTAKAFVSAMADKNYEKAAQYSSIPSNILEVQFKDDDFSGFTYKSEIVNDELLTGFTFENKDGVVLSCPVYKKDGKVGIGTGFND